MSRLRELEDEQPAVSFRTWVKILVGGWIHPLGVHTWVRHQRHDPASDALVDVGVVCWHCPIGKPG